METEATGGCWRGGGIAKKNNNFWAVKQQYNNKHAKQQKHQVHRPAEAAWSGRAEW